MDRHLDSILDKALGADVYKCVLSAPQTGERHQRVVLTKLVNGWQAESLTVTQAFHQNMDAQAMGAFVRAALGPRFRHLNSWDGRREHRVRISKKGKPLYMSSQADQAPRAAEGHNREKRYLLPQGAAVAPLVDMGVFTAEGKVAAAMQHKYRQINRFVEIIDDAVKTWPEGRLRVIDFGCGKSYLTFVLYYYLTQVRRLEVEMVGLDLKAEVIDKCNAAARKYGYDGLSFSVGDIAGFTPGFTPDMVISLHACDTATDHALYNAIQWGAKLIFAAPCCQHELNAQMGGDQLAILTRYGIVQERTAALMTDAIRANLLTARGYKTQLLEFIDIGHTPKNILIRAVKAPGTPRDKAMEEVRQLCGAFGFRPTLLRLLEEGGGR